MYRPFVCKIIPSQLQFAHIYLLHLFLLQRASQVHSKSKQKGQGKAGESATLSPKNPRQPPYPCFHLILPASTTDKLIFESRVLVVYLTSAVALCLPPVLLCLYPSRLARESYLVILVLTDTYHCLNRQTAAHSLDLTNYKLSKYAGTFTSPQYWLTYHTIKQAIMHSKVAASSKA
mgnify:CR=1 FL=1